MRLSFSKLFPWHPTPDEYAETLRADAHRAMLESMQRQYVAVSRTAPTLADLVDAALKGLDSANLRIARKS